MSSQEQVTQCADTAFEFLHVNFLIKSQEPRLASIFFPFFFFF